MKNKTTAAILIASAMMLTLMGCGEASTENAPATGELSIEALAPDEGTDVLDPSSSTSAEADSETASDADSSASNSEDASIEINGKKVSILDDLQTTMDALGTADGDPSSDASKALYYSFASGAIEYTTVKLDGEELPLTLDIRSGDYKTSKGVGIGSTEDEVVAAYGEPTKVDNGEELVAESSNGKTPFLYVTEYKLDGYTIVFKYSEDKKVEKFWFNHNANNARYDNQ